MNYEKNSARNNTLHQQHDDWDEVHNQLLAIQKKSLEISDPNDASEKEADAVAGKVAAGQSTQIHGTGGTINRKGEGSAEASPEFQSQLQNNLGNGQPLDEPVRTEMESKMGADFSDVKIHTGNEAQQLSENINAKAFTHEQDIFFNRGQFNSDSKHGKELLAHELTHTVQQGKTGVNRKIQRAVLELKTTDFETIVQLLHTELYKETIEPEAILMLLQKLNRIKEYIDAVHTEYNAKFKNAKSETGDEKNSLTIDISEKLADKKYDAYRNMMLDLLKSTADTYAIHMTNPSTIPDTDEKHKAKADAINAALKIDPVDATAIFGALMAYERTSDKLDRLREIYKKNYGSKKSGLEEQLRAKMTNADQLRYALYLLNQMESLYRVNSNIPVGSKNIAGKDELTDADNIKNNKVATGTEKVPGGGTVAANMQTEFINNKGGTTDEILGLTYSGGLAFDTHWLQFMWADIIAYSNGTPEAIPGSMRPTGGVALPKGKLDYTTKDKNWMVDSGSKNLPYYDVSMAESGDAANMPYKDFAADRGPGSSRMYDRPDPSGNDIYRELNKKGTEKVIATFHFTTFLVRDDKPLTQIVWNKVATYEPKLNSKISLKDGEDDAAKIPKSSIDVFESATAVTQLPGELHDVLVSEYPKYSFIR